MLIDKILYWISNLISGLFITGLILLAIPFFYMCFIHKVDRIQIYIGATGFCILVLTLLLTLISVGIWGYRVYKKDRDK